jgi:hypothetical protein
MVTDRNRSRASMKVLTVTHLFPSIDCALSRACIRISAAMSSPCCPQSTQCKSEWLARWCTGFTILSCISSDAASASRGSDPEKVTNVLHPVVVARHSHMWRSICLQATSWKFEDKSNSRVNRTERHAREPGPELSFFISLSFPSNSFCFAKSRSSLSSPSWS